MSTCLKFAPIMDLKPQEPRLLQQRATFHTISSGGTERGRHNPLLQRTDCVRLSPLAAYASCIYTAHVNTWDERKRRRNLKDHGIDFADLEGFFDGDLLTPARTHVKPMVKHVTKASGV